MGHFARVAEITERDVMITGGPSIGDQTTIRCEVILVSLMGTGAIEILGNEG